MKTSAFRQLIPALFISLATSAVAQQTNAAKHCLWEVEHGTNKVYLFGTIHYSSSNFFPLPAVIEQAYARSQSIMFENDIDEEMSPEGRSDILAASRYPPGDSLRNHLSSQVYSNVQAYLIETGAKGSHLDALKPFAVAVALADHAVRELDMSMFQSVDKYFWDKARKDNKRVIPLETFHQTLAIVASLNDSQQESMVIETLREIAKTNDNIRIVSSAWIHGETEKIDKLLFEALRRNPELLKILATDRNRKWIPSIEAEIKRGQNVFIAVGLGHLLGKESLVDLLSKRGFKVRQL